MPEELQVSLSDELTRLLMDVLGQWNGAPLRLSYLTEAGCKIVFTQRFKCAGMKWGIETGAPTRAPRVSALSGIWSEARDAMFVFQTDELPQLPTYSTTQT